MSSTNQWVLAFSPSVVLLLLAGGIKLFAKKWMSKAIDLKFKKSESEYQMKLEREHSSFKADLEKDLRDFQFKTDSKLSRITKIQEKELDVLPEVWNLMLHAITYLDIYVGKGLTYGPNFSRLSQDGKLKILKSYSWLDEANISELLNSNDIDKSFQAKQTLHNRWRSECSFNDFHNFLNKNKIFIESSIYKMFDEVRNEIRSAHVSFEIGSEANDHLMIDKARRSDFKGNLEVLSTRIRSRLRLEEA